MKCIFNFYFMKKNYKKKIALNGTIIDLPGNQYEDYFILLSTKSRMEKIPSTTNPFFDLFTELYQNIVTNILFLMAALLFFQDLKHILPCAPLVAEE